MTNDQNSNADGASATASPKPPAWEDIYLTLREMILNFDLHPGSRVTETEVARYFGVSRTPVREALMRLEHEGHLSERTKQGCFVRQLDIAELSQYYRVRTELEMAAVEEACQHMPSADIEQLVEQWNPDAIPAKLDSPSLELNDESFHMAFAVGSGNAVLVKYLRDINDHIRVIRRVDFDNPERARVTYHTHFKIASAVLQREVLLARNLMKRHIRTSEEFAKTLTLTYLARRKNLTNRLGGR